MPVLECAKCSGKIGDHSTELDQDEHNVRNSLVIIIANCTSKRDIKVFRAVAFKLYVGVKVELSVRIGYGSCYVCARENRGTLADRL